MTKRRRTHRLREGDQIPTHAVTLEEIMSEPAFALGAADVRAGRGFHPDYASWDDDLQWSYERGRQWARLAPPSVALKRDGRITREAEAWYMKADIP